MLAISIIVVYFAIGLMLSFYGSSFIMVNFKDQYRPEMEAHDWGILVYLVLTVTTIWPGFVIIVSIVNIFEKSLVRDLNKDFGIVMDHHFGEIVPMSRFV